jgi:thioredoxin
MTDATTRPAHVERDPSIPGIDDVDFLAATEGGYTAVDFWAPWCGPCHQFAPLFEAVATKYADQIRFARCDVDQSPRTAEMVGIMSIPTVVVFDPNGNELARISGVSPPMQVDALIRDIAGLAGRRSQESPD